MDFTFTATDKSATTAVPYYEDARADFAPYYRSGKSVKVAKTEVSAELTKLDAVVIAFREGFFGQKPRRYGYEIEFLLYDRRGILRVAGLPMRRETPAKIEQVRVQALLNVRDWLKVAVKGCPPAVEVLAESMSRRTAAGQQADTEGGFPPLLAPND